MLIKFDYRGIVQASDLKASLEKLNINETIASIDADLMNPSIKFDLICKAINYYSRSLNQSL